MKSKISSFFEKNVGKLALSGIVFALALVVALTTAFVFNGKKLENKTTPPTNAETTIVPYNQDSWTDAGNYDTVNVATGDGFSGGDGSEADPYIISTARQLAGLAVEVNNGNAPYKYFKVVNDINLLDHYWTPIGNENYQFEGCFDGDGHELTGMVIDINDASSNIYAGFFGYVQGYEGNSVIIKNLKLSASEINAVSNNSLYMGSIIGSANHIELTNCQVNVKLSASGSENMPTNVGGVIGRANYGNVSSTSFSGEVNINSSYVISFGGVIGVLSSGELRSNSNFSSLIISGTLTGSVMLGGICGNAGGMNSTIIQDSFNKGNISADLDIPYGDVRVGGIAGSTWGAIIKNCYNQGELSAKNSNGYGSAYAGGIVGKIDSETSIINSFNLAKISGKVHGGILGGINWDGSVKEIKNSYIDSDIYTGKVFGQEYDESYITIMSSGKVAGLSGLMKDTANYGVESFGTYTDDNSLTGSAVWSSESPWDFENVWGEDVFGTNNGYPVLRTKEYNDMLPLLDKHWKHNAATSYAGGDGTQSNPYLISTAEELALLSNDVNSGKFYDQETGEAEYIYVELTADIDLSGKYWTPIGHVNWDNMMGYSFIGSFDGKKHEIMNLEYDTSSLGMFVGVFGFVGKMDGQVNEKYNEIKNLGISGNDIELIFPSSSQTNGMGIGIAGITSYAIHTKIEDCYNKANITVEGAYGTVAGIVGAMSGEVKNCYNTGDLTMNIDIGDGNNSYNANVGGIVGGGGLASGNIDLISNCYNSGKLSAETSGYCMNFGINIGGISVSWAGEIKNSYNIGDIYGQSNASESTPSSLSLGGVNGFIGSELSLAIYNSFNIGQITGSYSGGNNLPEYSPRNMNAKGGILGWKTSSSNLTISNSYFSNSYFDSSKFSGNLTGRVDGTDVYEVINSGKVSGLSEKMRDKTNYGVSSFGTYTDDNSATGNAIWTKAWDFAFVWMIEQGFNFEYPIFKTMEDKMWKYDDNVLAITGFSKGLGTAESPYQISSAEELAYLSNEVNSGKFYNPETKETQYIYVELTADIDLSGKYWTPIIGNLNLSDGSGSGFVGSFDGKGYEINGMTMNFETSFDSVAGLFGSIGNFNNPPKKEIEIENVALNNCDLRIIQADYEDIMFGGLVGISVSKTRLQSNSINGNLHAETKYTAGLVGYCVNEITINNCHSRLNIYAGDKTNLVGGFIAEFFGEEGRIEIPYEFYASTRQLYGEEVDLDGGYLSQEKVYELGFVYIDDWWMEYPMSYVEDAGYFIEFLLETPQEEIDEIRATYPLLKERLDVIVSMLESYGIDYKNLGYKAKE